jgi:hypothetical protein
MSGIIGKTGDGKIDEHYPQVILDGIKGFFELVVLSVLIGMFFGIIPTLITKV